MWAPHARQRWKQRRTPVQWDLAALQQAVVLRFAWPLEGSNACIAGQLEVCRRAACHHAKNSCVTTWEEDLCPLVDTGFPYNVIWWRQAPDAHGVVDWTPASSPCAPHEAGPLRTCLAQVCHADALARRAGPAGACPAMHQLTVVMLQTWSRARSHFACGSSRPCLMAQIVLIRQ